MNYTKTEEELGRGQIELASELCESQTRVRELEKALRNAALNFHTYRKTLDLGYCGISTTTFDNCKDSGCRDFRALLTPVAKIQKAPFDPLHEDTTHFCGNTRSIELFPKSACTCGNDRDNE